MAFFKDLGKKISEGVQDASEKASELVELNKLNSAISKEKNSINEVKRQIGEKVFAMYRGGETVPSTLYDDLRIIDAHLQAVDGFEAKIAELKGAPTAYQDKPAAADPVPPAPTAPEPTVVEASARQDELQAPAASAPAMGEETAPERRFCPNCGAKLVEGTAFCGECGQKV